MREGDTHGIARLLAEDLREVDHGLGVEFLGQVHHVIRVVLLVAVACGGEERAKRVDGDGVALSAATRLVLLTVIRRVLAHREGGGGLHMQLPTSW